MTKRYQMLVFDMPSTELGNFIDMVHSRGGEIRELGVMLNGKPTRVNGHPQRSRKLRFTIGPSKKQEGLKNQQQGVMHQAIKYAATQPDGICSRIKFQHFVASSTLDITKTGISPCVSQLLDRGALVEVDA